VPHGQPAGPRRCALAALLSGSLLAVGAPAGWLLLGAEVPEQFGSGAATALARHAPPPAALDPPAQRGGWQASGAGGATRDAAPPAPAAPRRSVATRSARLADVAVPEPPALLRLGGATVPVDPVGLDDARRVVVPDDVRRVGWYAPGVAPGAGAGSAVLVGHVDDRDQGLGAFARLRELTAGAEVVVESASGARTVYGVVALEQFAKAEVPMSRLFAVDGPHRLVLVSCAGPFDSRTSTYRDNLVVTAVSR